MYNLMIPILFCYVVRPLCLFNLCLVLSVVIVDQPEFHLFVFFSHEKKLDCFSKIRFRFFFQLSWTLIRIISFLETYLLDLISQFL